MKTFDRKDIFTIANVEDAKEYVGKLGYPSNSLSKLKQLVNNFSPYSLDKIEIDNDKPFFYRHNNFLFFLPADKVIEIEEKKWRAFKNLDDLKTYANKSVGSILVYRQKNKDQTMRTSVITDYIFTADCIFIGNKVFFFETLFDEYELLNEHGIWQPFGVEE